MITKDDFSPSVFRDGSVCLSCGPGMGRDLVFASGAMKGDPDLAEQKAIIEFIMKAISIADAVLAKAKETE